MKLATEPNPVLAVSLNTAWQNTYIFSHVEHGEVNRAQTVKECGGGKGINVVRVFRHLGYPIVFAGFAGGDTGKKLEQELSQSGAIQLLGKTQATTRTCITVISEDNGEVTELIGSSGAVSDQEKESLLQQILSQIPASGALVFSGSVPPGVTPAFCTSIARTAYQAHIPFVLDAVKDITPVLQEGVTLLKINASELRQITGVDSIDAAGQELLHRFPRLQALAITDGPRPAWLFVGQQIWTFSVPRLEKIVSPIGCGDCATAIMTRRIAEKISPADYPKAFAEALACASASCFTNTPSLFDNTQAEEILSHITITPYKK